MNPRFKLAVCITSIFIMILTFTGTTYAQLLKGEYAFQEFRINPSANIRYYLDTNITNKYLSHTDAYKNAITKFDSIDGANISFKQVSNKENALIELSSVNSQKEEWVGIAKTAYNEFTNPVPKVTKSEIFLNESTISSANLTQNHTFEIALHELGHTFGLMHQNQDYDEQTIMAPYIIQSREGRVDLTDADKENIRIVYSLPCDWENHWAKEIIQEFLEKGYVSGYTEGIVKPDNYITRAEFVSIINRIFGLTKTSNVVFKDTNSHWAKETIDIAVTNGICKGKSDTIFDPDGYITREEAAVMVANLRKIDDKSLDKLSTYSDGYKSSEWAKSSIEAVIEHGYMNGYSNNTFRPKNKITRAEAMATLSRVEK